MKKINSILVIFLALICFFGCNPDDETVNNEPSPGQNQTGTLNLGASVSRDFIGQILDESNNPIAGASVKVGGITKLTDVNGMVIVKNATVNEQMAYVTVTKIGFLDGSRSLVPTTGINNLKIVLYSSAATQTISSGVASTVLLPNGTKVTFDGSFKTDTGAAYSGSVSVVLKHLTTDDTKYAQKMPGMLLAQNTAGEERILETYGMINVVLKGAAGQNLQIVNPATIELTIPNKQLATAPATIPLWHFDEVLGYWKEDGSATRDGNAYKGTVKHFSWWNCDAPFPKASLTVKIVTSSGIAISNVRVDIIPAGFTYGGTAVTNTLGLITGIVPANLALQIKVYDTCNNLILTQSQTALAMGSNLTLPNIILSNSVVGSSLVTGNLLKCDNTNITNGYIIINYGGLQSVSSVTNGAFSFATLVCPATPNSFTIQGFDFDSLQTTGIISSNFTFPNTVLGNIPVCNAVNEYISYQIDGQATVTYITNLQVSNNQGTSLYISASSPAPSGPNFFLQGNSITPGTYTTNTGFSLEGSFLLGTSFISPTTPNTISFNLNSFGAIGQYVDLTFNGNYTDTANVAHTITGSVHALRDN